MQRIKTTSLNYYTLDFYSYFIIRYIYCFFLFLIFLYSTFLINILSLSYHYFIIFLSISLFLWIFLYVCTIYAPGQLRQHTEIIQREPPGEAATASHGTTAVTTATTTINALARNSSLRPAIPVSCWSVSSTDVAHGQPVSTGSQYRCT